MTAFSPEVRLIYRCADQAATSNELLALATDVRDWARALTLAEREAATPRLWRCLHEVADRLPSAVAEFMRARAMLSDFRMLQLSQRLAATVAEFRARGIPLLLLKGAAVGARVDPSFRTRPMTDVDALIHHEDTARAHEALAAAGWQQSADPRLHELLEDMHHEAAFYHASLPGLRFELHSKVLPPDHPFAWDERSLWATATDAPAPFEGAKIPSPTNLVLHAAVHFAWQHGMAFGTWRTMRTVCLLVSQGAFDWEGCVAQARNARALTSLYWTLRLTENLVGAQVPPPVLAASAPPTPAAVRDAIERFVLSSIAPGESPMSPSSRLSRLLWRAAIRPKWSGHHAGARAHTDREWAQWRGTYQPETPGRKVVRHIASYRDWWSFLRHTLLGA